SEHFERHGFRVSEETKKVTGKYEKPEHKIWYSNYSVFDYKGDGIKDKEVPVDVNLAFNKEDKANTLQFFIDNSYNKDLLGYEIIRDGKVIGFTSTNKFVDKDINTSKSYKYEVIGYDKKLNP